MSIYMTEEEQLENIKKWWKKYNNVIMIVLSLILLTISGIKYWHWHKEKINGQASSSYEQLMIAFSNHDNKLVSSYANQLISEYRHTVYADAARLTLAKLFVANGQYDKAKEALESVVNHSKINALKQVAKIRMARLLVAEKDYNKALAELATMNDEIYRPDINELKGDIYVATGQYPQALASYKEAIKEMHTNGIGNLFLEMKTNELGPNKPINKE